METTTPSPPPAFFLRRRTPVYGRHKTLPVGRECEGVSRYTYASKEMTEPEKKHRGGATGSQRSWRCCLFRLMHARAFRSSVAMMGIYRAGRHECQHLFCPSAPSTFSCINDRSTAQLHFFFLWRSKRYEREERRRQGPLASKLLASRSAVPLITF